ncbi:MAG TPA: tetratricopeptide repeat protein [Flavobacteriaceae bacterium]|nr:tetratricopeptide repeat protein [Flavobacteriaceae bacterium]
MKNLILFILLIGVHSLGFSQEIEFDEKDILKEIAEQSCECIDSINTIDKSVAEKNAEISTCIDESTGAYQFLLKLNAANAQLESSEESEEIKIELNPNKDSEEYKSYYYEIERYLMSNCPALKTKMSDKQKLSEYSLSENDEAYYSYIKGIDEMQQENFDQAVKYFQHAVEIDPEFAFAWDNLGLSYRNLNQFDQAIEAYEQSLTIDPNGMMPMQNIAIAYQYKKEYKKAIGAFKKLAEVDQSNPEVYYGIGTIYAVKLENYTEGLDYMCNAYNLYIEQKSPYRTDAENIINYIYQEMKKQGKEDKFDQILKANNISQSND